MSFWGVDLTGRDLSGNLNLSGCDFSRAVSLSGCNMSGANLQRARFAGLSLNGLDLSGADCTGADFSGCDFTGIKPAAPPPVLTRANLTGAALPAGISWPGAKMAGAGLAQAKLSCDLSGTATDLTGANFSGQGASYFTPVYQGGGFGGFNLTNRADQVIAYDYASSGKRDHLVCYRPGPGFGMVWIVRRNADGTFTQVYGQQGIGGWDLAGPGDQIIAYDYDGTGHPDHLVCYRPGKKTIWILKEVKDTDSPDAFVAVYHQGDGPGAQGIGGYNLADPADRIIAYDYDGTGHLDHLVCYRPSTVTGIIWILKKVKGTNSPDTFAPVYQGGGLGSGVGGSYDLAVGTDRIITYDYGTGEPGYLACYRPGGGVIWIIQNKAAGPAALTGCHLDKANLSGVSLAGFDLTTVTLAGANLSGASLAHAKLTQEADLTGAKLPGTDFTGLDLTQVRFSFPLTRSTNPAHPTIFTQCKLPYTVIAKDWACLDLTDATITGVPTDLTGLNAQGLRRLRGNFTKLTLDGANFAGASLNGANFSGASLQGKASFAGAKMPGAFFIQAVLDQVDFTGATLDGTDRTEAANFSYACLSNCVFTGAGLYAVIFAGATLIELILAGSGVNLQLADFSDAYLPNADFTGASLQGAKFNGACMVECILTNADLTPAAAGTLQASLAGACLQGATLTGTKLGGASLPDSAITNADGQITVQYYEVPGTLTDPYPMPYSGTSYPDPSSLSGTTVCPNTITYQENLANGLTIAQMMTAPNPPTQWKPRNTIEDQDRLAASITSTATAPVQPADPMTHDRRDIRA